MKKGNEKFVGATIGRPHFEGMTQKDKGITLIALIITIIVVLILVGVTVNVALNGGLFDIAKQAASGMNMAQIRERAEMVKVTLMADMLSDETIMGAKAEYLTRLQEDLGGDIEGNKLMVQERKYYIVVKNADLDIDVIENADSNVEATYLTTTNYEINNTDENTINIEFTISSDMTLEEYINAKSANLTQQDKEKIAVEWFYSWYNVIAGNAEELGIVKFEDLIVNDMNVYYETTYESIEECLEDENVQAEWGTTEEQLYYFWYNYCTGEENESQEMTAAELTEIFYTEAKETEFNWNTKNLRLFVSKDGATEVEIENGIDIRTEPKTITYTVEENGTYEFIVKTNSRRLITSEIFKINNL